MQQSIILGRHNAKARGPFLRPFMQMCPIFEVLNLQTASLETKENSFVLLKLHFQN